MSVLRDLVTSFPASIQSLYCSRKITEMWPHDIFIVMRWPVSQRLHKHRIRLKFWHVMYSFFFKNFPLSVSGLCAISVLFLTAWHLLKSPHLNDSLHLSHFIWSSKAPGNSEIIMKAASHWCSSKECWEQEVLFLEGTVLTAHLLIIILAGCRLLVLHYLTRMFCCVMMVMLTDVLPVNETLSLLFCQSFYMVLVVYWQNNTFFHFF